MTSKSTSRHTSRDLSAQTSQRTSRYIARGVTAAMKKPGVILLVWAIQFLVALIVAIPMGDAMSLLAETGFSADMARQIDLGIIFDMIDTVRPAIRLTVLNLLWAIPLLAAIRAVTNAGIIDSVRDEGIRPFWGGVSRYGARFVALAIPYFFLTAFIQVGFLFVLIAMAEGGGERMGVLSFLLVAPLGMAVIGGIADCMRDYSQISLASRNISVVTAIGRGVQWPFRHPASLVLYVAWMLIGIVFAILPLLLENWIPAATISAIIFLTVGQQVALIVRSAITVAWFGSEVSFFEAYAEDEPLIAETNPDTGQPDNESDHTQLGKPLEDRSPENPPLV